jgi:radical SAM protein with 4Fe4S-binding SPASM domain
MAHGQPNLAVFGGATMRIELHSRVQQIQLAAATRSMVPFRNLGGRFFRELMTLPAGGYVARVQIMFSEFAAGELIRISATRLADGRTLDTLELAAVAENRATLDHLYLRFRLEAEDGIELCGYTEANCASTLLRMLTVVSAENGIVDPDAFSFQGYTKPSIKDLRCVIFGTTAICNASCIHCPTNKVFRKGFPHGRMNLELFQKIVTDLRDGEFAGWFLFGLYGEPLEDTLLEQRLKIIRQLLPLSPISIATNCGVFDSGKHAFIVDLADDIGVHVEAITPEIYDRFMDPLKAERVFPKIISLLSLDKGKKVHITSPLHKGNLAELERIHTYFEAYGARESHFTPIGNRSWEGGPWGELSLLPVGGLCSPHALEVFVVDWDGTVVACCSDFSKSLRLGDLTRQSVSEVLNSEAWNEMFEIHRTKNWCQKEACGRCRFDSVYDVNALVESRLGNRRQHFAGRAFSVCGGVLWGDDDIIRVGKEVLDGIVIYGPYRRFVTAGRHSVHHFIEVTDLPGAEAHIDLDVVSDYLHQIAYRRFPITTRGPLELGLEFDNDGSSLEFRVAKVGVEFTHRGAVFYKK